MVDVNVLKQDINNVRNGITNELKEHNAMYDT